MLSHCNLLSVQGVAQYFAWRNFLNQFISFHLGKTGRIDHFSKLQIVKLPFWPTDMLFACTQKILLEKRYGENVGKIPQNNMCTQFNLNHHREVAAIFVQKIMHFSQNTITFLFVERFP